MLLLADVLKSVSLCTSLPQDSLLGLLSTGEGGKLLISAFAERAGMVEPFAVFNSMQLSWSAVNAETKKTKDEHSKLGIGQKKRLTIESYVHSGHLK